MNRTFERITNDSLIKQSSTGGLVSYLKVCFSYLLDFLLGCSKIFKTILQKKRNYASEMWCNRIYGTSASSKICVNTSNVTSDCVFSAVKRWSLLVVCTL